MPGVGSTSTRITVAPALVRPATTAASSISPLARGSRPTTASGGWDRSASASTWAAATATDIASSGLRSALASPRMPSVPNSRPIESFLVTSANLTQPQAVRPNATPDPTVGRHPRRTTSAGRQTTAAGPPLGRPGRCTVQRSDSRFEYCGALRAFLRPYFLLSLTRASRVRKPAFFSAGRSSGVELDQRAGDGQPQRAGLAGHAAAAQVGDDVEGVRPLGDRQRLAHELLVHLAREVRLEGAAVQGELAGAGDDADPDDGLLAAADGLDRTLGAAAGSAGP